MAHAPRNSFLAPGITKHSKAVSYKRRGLFKRPRTATPAKKASAATTITKTIGGSKNGQTRVVPAVKASKFYPAEDEPKPKTARRTKTVKPARLRSSITPGTVLILLSGRFRGRRVVFLKQLASGLLLITGPYKINGVPLRRVNQAYVIATSTKLDVAALQLDAKINDEYFKREAKQSAGKTEAGFFKDRVDRKPRDANKVADQKRVDALVLAAVAKQTHLRAYLGSSFALTKGQAPHLMQF